MAMFNFDGLGNGNGLGILGSRELTNLVIDQGKERGIEVAASSGLAGGSSDHASFVQVGIPVIMFFSDDFTRLHTQEDTLAFINPRLLGDAALLAMDLLESIGNGMAEKLATDPHV